MLATILSQSYVVSTSSPVGTRKWVDPQKWKESHIVLIAWSFLQDSFHTTLNLHHSANKMAVAVLYLAVHCCKLQVPSEGAEHQWWEVMHPGIEEVELQDIAHQIMNMVDSTESSNSKN